MSMAKAPHVMVPSTQQISKPQQNPCSAKRSAVYNAKWQLHLNWLSI